MKIFLDANVIFSASLPKEGVARALLFEAADRGAMCISSGRAFAEVRRNLLAKAPQAMAEHARIAARIVEVPEPAPGAIDAATGAGIVAKDAPIFAAALQCEADMFVTGDLRHFGHLAGRRVDGVLVLSLRTAYEHLIGTPARGARGRSR